MDHHPQGNIPNLTKEFSIRRETFDIRELQRRRVRIGHTGRQADRQKGNWLRRTVSVFRNLASLLLNTEPSQP